jgi:anti-anti-sigma factor
MNQSAVVVDNARVLQLQEDVVALAVPRIRDLLKERLATGEKELVIDLSSVRMVDSAGIGLLVSAHNSLKKAGGSLELIHVGPELRDLFRTMRLHRHFRISGE